MDDNCLHDIVWAGLCAVCGKEINTNAGVPFSSVFVSEREAKRQQEDTEKRLVSSNKLGLVLDLDHTLLHATTEHFVKDFQKESDVFEFILPPITTKYYLKLRPGLQVFLEELHKLYEMHIYTMGTKQYAQKVAEIIDKDNTLFKEYRIVSRDDGPGDINFKNLKRIFPCDDSMVVIVDDREDVWMTPDRRVSANLIRISPFHYFSTTHEINALPNDVSNSNGVSHDTSPPQDNYLYYIGQILKNVHNIYYQPTNNNNNNTKDVKKILSELREKVLNGCVIVFSGLIPINNDPSKSDIWRLAVSFGAVCQTEVTSQTTHLIAAKLGTGKVEKAVKRKNIKIININWLFECCKRWQRVSEDEYNLKGHESTDKEESEEEETHINGTHNNDINRPVKKTKLESEEDNIQMENSSNNNNSSINNNNNNVNGVNQDSNNNIDENAIDVDNDEDFSNFLEQELEEQ